MMFLLHCFGTLETSILLHVMSSWFNLVESNYKLPQNVPSYVRSHTSWPTSSFTQGSSNLSRGAVVKNVQKENWKSLQLKVVKAAQLRTANNRHTLVMTATPVKLTRIDVALLPVWKKWQLLVGGSSIFVWWIFAVRCMGKQLRSNQCGPPTRPSLHQASGPLKTWIKWLSSGLKIRSKKPCPSWPSRKEKHTQASDCVTLVTHNRSTSSIYIYIDYRYISIYTYTLVYIFIYDMWLYIYPALSTLFSRNPRIILTIFPLHKPTHFVESRSQALQLTQAYLGPSDFRVWITDFSMSCTPDLQTPVLRSFEHMEEMIHEFFNQT